MKPMMAGGGGAAKLKFLKSAPGLSGVLSSISKWDRQNRWVL